MKTGPTFLEVEPARKWRWSEKSRQRRHHHQHDGMSTVGRDHRQGPVRKVRGLIAGATHSIVKLALR